ncbi:hypothetical protein H8E77_17760, partial [bacterium]|nr:hypothetical protein [bacterium]
MKNHLFTLTAMFLVTLLVVSLSEGQATFRMVEEGSPPYGIGQTFSVAFVADAAVATDVISSLSLYIDFDAFDVGTISPVLIPPDNEVFYDIDSRLNFVNENGVVSGNLSLKALSFPSPGLPQENGIVIARADFQQIATGPSRLVYQIGGDPETRYTLGYPIGTAPIENPIVSPLDVGLPVSMSAFTVASADEGVMVKWRTESELNNLGFDVYRSERLDGTFAKVNQSRIPGAGTDGTPHSYQFTDESVEVGKTYYYYLEDISYSGVRNRSHIIQVTVDATGKLKVIGLAPSTFALLQNYPNPFNPETWIPYQLARNASVTVRIYNLKGQPIHTIALGQKAAGTYSAKDKAVY